MVKAVAVSSDLPDYQVTHLIPSVEVQALSAAIETLHRNPTYKNAQMLNRQSRRAFIAVEEDAWRRRHSAEASELRQSAIELLGRAGALHTAVAKACGARHPKLGVLFANISERKQDLILG